MVETGELNKLQVLYIKLAMESCHTRQILPLLRELCNTEKCAIRPGISLALPVLGKMTSSPYDNIRVIARFIVANCRSNHSVKQKQTYFNMPLKNSTSLWRNNSLRSTQYLFDNLVSFLSLSLSASFLFLFFVIVVTLILIINML